jgi:hypothetical protein
MPTKTKTALKVADEVWISVVLLHREHPGQPDFTIDEIVERVRKAHLAGKLRASVYVHILQHCVANRPPNSARHRMLYETASGRRRLFRKGDPYNPAREGSKISPAPEDLPEGYGGLLSWYRDWESARRSAAKTEDSLLSLRGTGKELWASEHADEYVRRLREGWE